MRIGTLFSGGLAACEFALRYEDFEHEVVFACEWDKYARKQYLEFHGEPKTFYEDVSNMCGKKYLDGIDLMVWGSPCQDLSLAGKRKGFDGEKSSLFREGARIMSEVMPKAFIFENVKGLLSSNSGNDYKEVVKTFQDMGYLIASKVVNAKEHGTAQNRERVFIVGFLDVNEYHDFNFAEHIPLTKVLRDYLEDDVSEKYYLSDDRTFELTGKEIGVVAKLTDTKFESAQRIQGVGGVASTLITQQGGDQEPKILVKSQANTIHRTDKEMATLCAGTHGYAQGYVKIGAIRGRNPDNPKSRTAGLPTQQILEINEGGTSNCLTSVQKDNVVIEAFRIRRLTPIECFRLQGVKDEDIKLINSDTQSYKIAGNAIEVNTMRSLIRQLYKPVKQNNTLF